MPNEDGSPTRRRPAGIPVSQALLVPAGPEGDPIREVVAAVDRAHGDGRLPPIVVSRRRLPPGFEGLYKPSPPYAIVVGVQARQPALTLLHEIGHCLDHLGLGQAAAFASEADPSLNVWRTAITSSPALDKLVQLSRATTEPGLVDALRYLMTWPEFWARSYAQ